MTDPTDLQVIRGKRKEKAPRCEMCGNPVHEFEGQCPRVVAITKGDDGSVTYWLSEIEQPDLAG